MPKNDIHPAEQLMYDMMAEKFKKPETPHPPDYAICPNCEESVEDWDGFGVLAHLGEDGCGYCSHPSITGDICDCCGKEIAECPECGANIPADGNCWYCENNPTKIEMIDLGQLPILTSAGTIQEQTEQISRVFGVPPEYLE